MLPWFHILLKTFVRFHKFTLRTLHIGNWAAISAEVFTHFKNNCRLFGVAHSQTGSCRYCISIFNASCAHVCMHAYVSEHIKTAENGKMWVQLYSMCERGMRRAIVCWLLFFFVFRLGFGGKCSRSEQHDKEFVGVGIWLMKWCRRMPRSREQRVLTERELLMHILWNIALTPMANYDLTWKFVAT